MRLAAENPHADPARRRAIAAVSWPLRDLASNLMRVVRGAGKPHEIVRQTRALMEAFADYHEATGEPPSADVLADILSIERDPEIIQHLERHQVDRLDAEQLVIHGALQVAASRLVEQKTQETVGRHELHEGVRAIREADDEVRRACAPRLPAAQTNPRPERRATKPKS
jgi:hypothetical protein